MAVVKKWHEHYLKSWSEKKEESVQRAQGRRDIRPCTSMVWARQHGRQKREAGKGEGRCGGGRAGGGDSMLEVRQEIHGINPITVERAVSAPVWQEQGGEEKPSVGRSCAVWHCPATSSTRERGRMCAAEESREVQPPWVTQGGAYLPWEVEPPLERWKCTFCHLLSLRCQMRVSSDCMVTGIPVLLQNQRHR